MIDYVYRAVNCIAKQLEYQNLDNAHNYLFLLYGDEGVGKSTIAKEYTNIRKGTVSYRCNNEFDLLFQVTGAIIAENYNRHLNLFYPLIKKIKEEKIHTIIFDIEGKANADYFELLYNLFISVNQQNYKLWMVLFVDSNVYHHNHTIFAKYPQLTYLEPLEKWNNTDFFQLWESLYKSDDSYTDIIKLVSSYSMGNAGIFLRHLNTLKYYNVLRLKNDKWNFIKETNIDTLLREQFSEIVRKKYELLEPSLQTVIMQTSTIGYLFKKKDLRDVFNVENVTSVLKQIQILTYLLYFTDAKLEHGKFDSIQVQTQIEKQIDSEHHRTWCIALAQYYESKIDFCSPNSIELYRCQEKCVFYYEKANELSKIIYHYVSLVPLLCYLNLYNSALEISLKLRDLTKGKFDYKNYYNYSFYLLAQINRKISNYNKAINYLKKYIALTKINKQNNELDYLTAELLYGIGETPKAYSLLKTLYNKTNSIDDPTIKLNVISLLSSVEETIDNSQYIKHYNEALYLCASNNMNKDYNRLLRKANMAHEGYNAIMLMKKSEEYFKNSNDIIELIMVKHNIGTESLFYENTYTNAKENLESAYKLAGEYGFDQLAYTINSLAILEILEENYRSAEERLTNLLKLEQEDFTLLALYINKTTCLLKLNKVDEAIQLLKKAKTLNSKDRNKIPFYTIQIVLMESYIFLAQKDHLMAYQKLCQYFEHGQIDRSTGILSAKIVLSLLCKNYYYSYPNMLTELSANCDDIAIKMAKNHLVLCDLMFWE